MSNKKTDNPCDFGQYDSVWGQHRISCKIIIRITEDYIVFIDHKNNIDWETIDTYDASRPLDKKQEYEKYLSLSSIVEHHPIDGLSVDSVLSFKTIIGEAIVNILEGNFSESIDILNKADEFRLDRVVEKSREWYLVFTIAPTALFVIFVLMANAKNICIWPEMLPYINVGAWAVAGSCLSIILRSGRLMHGTYAGKRLHFIESCSRLIGGFLTGQLVYLGMKSGILFSSLVNSDSSQWLYPLFSLVAGASERFAPSIISKIEDASLIKEDSKEE